MDDAGDAAAVFSFDRDDEAFAADGDERVLRCAFFSELLEGAAERLFDRFVLALGGAADAAEFGRGIVRERAIGFDFSGDEFEQVVEVGGEQRRGEVGDGGPFVAHVVGRCGDEGAPVGDDLGYFGELADVERVERGLRNLRLLEEIVCIEERAEREGSSAGEKDAEFGDELLLAVDPGEVARGFAGEHAGAAERRLRFAGEVGAEAVPFKGEGAGFEQGRWCFGSHGYLMVVDGAALRWWRGLAVDVNSGLAHSGRALREELRYAIAVRDGFDRNDGIPGCSDSCPASD